MPTVVKDKEAQAEVMDDGDETKLVSCNVRTMLSLCLTEHCAMRHVRVKEELRVFNLGV